MHSHASVHVVKDRNSKVLILVLMEDALAHMWHEFYVTAWFVLILVLMEDALAHFTILNNDILQDTS